MATLKKQLEQSNKERGVLLDDQVKVFTDWIQKTPPIGGLNPQNFSKYNGKTNARDHLTAFQMTMHVISQDEAIWCKVFASTLTGKATTWFGRLPVDSINSWADFKKLFLDEFGAAGAIMKDETCLYEMRQRSGERISSYITRFKKELDSVEVIEEKSVIMCFVGGMHPGPLKTELMLRGPKNRVEMFLVAQKMASAEDNRDEKKGRSERREKTGESEKRADRVDTLTRRTDRPKNERRRRDNRREEENFTALNTTREQIMNILMRNNQLDPPQPLDPRLAQYRNTAKRCAYHNDIGHSTEECNQLKRAIQRLIDRGELEEYRAGRNRNPQRADQPRQEDRREGRNVIRTITDELPSTSQLKSKVFSLIHDVSVPGEQVEVNDTIGFRTYELATNEAARDQPLIIQVGVGNSDVMRVLVDTGATKDILFYSCFLALGLSDAHLTPSSIHLEGFTNHRVAAKGTVELEVVLGEGKIQKNRMVKFTVIDIKSSYNAILGTPSQSSFGLVASVAHQRVKFQTSEGIGCVRSNPKSFYDHLIEERKAGRPAADKVN